jgi:hypothetical protein
MQDHDESHEQQNPYSAPRSAPYVPPAVATAVLDGPFQPFKTIWLRPRATVRRIVAENPDLHVMLLVCLAGIGGSLDRASTRNAGDTLPLAAILVLACLIGPLAGMFGVWLFSHLIRLTGAWLGGVSPREHIKTAIAWALVPSVCGLLLWIPQIAVFGSEMFTTKTPTMVAQPVLLILLLAISLVELVLGVWGIVLLCNTIAEVQGFRSAWRGLGNVLLAGAIPAAVIVAIGVTLAFAVRR